MCNGICADTNSDPTNCGTCGYTCAQGTVCFGGLCLSSCGNSKVQTGEECDDGNRNNDDGCSSTCQKEPGFSCTGEPSVCTSRCGDGVKAPNEQCDDGDTSSSDGCSATCQIESGYACTGEPSVCTIVCGDGVVLGTETCDDGNTNNNDGCSSTCAKETGYSCTGAPSTCQTICGDGIKAGNEACDDTGTANGDGCSSTCAVESGYSCTGTPSTCTPVCGDGIKKGNEACDDGDTLGGDGCSATCTVESGYACTGTPSTCTTTCGDGIKAGNEACDDGNLSNLDGCTSTCTVKTGYTCNNASPNVCTTSCGDGIRAGTEACDDGDTTSGDGCSATCVKEAGYSCDLSVPNVCTTSCGDGVKAGTEACDDSNLFNGDGCSSTCAVESGYTCTGTTPSVCTPACGNGIKQGTEACDDGNSNSGDGCSSTCTLEQGFNCSGTSPTTCSAICGDGLRRGSEACDDQNTVNGDGCSSTCTLESGYSCNTATPNVCSPICGDGVRKASEACDDFNTFSGDGCSSTCAIEQGFTCNTSVSPTQCSAVCGDGLKRGSEGCDDQNLINGDGCSSTCTVETGYGCTNATSTSPSVCTIKCGDGLIRGTEQCDDGNTTSGDCCSSTCTLEPGCEIEPNDTVAQANNWSALQVSSKVKGKLLTDAGATTDVDVYSFQLTGAVNSLVAETVDGPTVGRCSGSYLDTQAMLSLPDGGVISDENSGQQMCALVNARGLPAGTYYVTMKKGTEDTFATDVNYGITAASGVCGNGIKERGEACDDGNLTDGDSCNSVCGWLAEVENNNLADGGTYIGVASMDAGLIVEGSMSPNTDVDYFSFTVPYVADVRLETFDFEGPSSCKGIDTVLDFYSPTVVALETDDESGVNSCSLITPASKPGARQLAPGTYYARVTAWQQTTIRSYTLKVDLLSRCGNGIKEGYEPCDGTANCTADCKRVAVCGDGIIDAPETCDDSNTTAGDGCSPTCQLEGVTQEVEPNNTTAQADATGLVASADFKLLGSISTAGDKDYLKVQVTTPGVVRFETFDGTSTGCASISTEVTLYDSAGTQVGYSLDNGILNCSALTTYLNAGTYYVAVNEYGNNSTIPSYILEVKFNANGGSEVEPNDTTSAATNISTNHTYVFGGHLVGTDIDTWAIPVPAGKSLRVELIEGDTSETCESNSIDSYLTLYSPTGTSLATDDDSGRGYCSLIDGTGPSGQRLDTGASNLAAGTYYVEVKPSTYITTPATDPTAQFNYRLLVTIR